MKPFAYTKKQRTIEFRWRETATHKLKMKEQANKQSRCFALTCNDLLGVPIKPRNLEQTKLLRKAQRLERKLKKDEHLFACECMLHLRLHKYFDQLTRNA